MCTKYHVSHELARHLLSFTRQGTNMTGMPWQFTKMKNWVGAIIGHLPRETVDELYDEVGLAVASALENLGTPVIENSTETFKDISYFLTLISWFIAFCNNFVCIHCQCTYHEQSAEVRF